MANWEMLENIETDIEKKEKEAEENKEELEDINKKIQKLESAVQSFEQDAELKSIVSGKVKEAQTEKDKVEKKREELLGAVGDLENEVAKFEEENAHSRHKIEELIGLGEEMSEAVELIEKREENIKESQKKLKALRSNLEKKLP